MEIAMVEWAKLVASIVASSVAAYWAFSTWMAERKKELQAREDRLSREQDERAKERQAREDQLSREQGERQDERERERKRVAALYVNPFLMACEDLQSRLYNVLDNFGLGPLRTKFPDGGYAEETLYLIAQYFAWEHCLYRYTVYAQDAEVIRLIEKIRKTFSTAELGLLEFCFFRLEQRSLGRLLLERAAGASGGEFDVVSFQTFKERLASTLDSHAPAIRHTLESLKKAGSMADLDSKDPKIRERLATVQHCLVELLEHIELREGITFRAPESPAGQREKAATKVARSSISHGRRDGSQSRSNP